MICFRRYSKDKNKLIVYYIYEIFQSLFWKKKGCIHIMKMRKENKRIVAMLVKINMLKENIEECKLFLNYFEAEIYTGHNDDIFFNVIMARSYRNEINNLKKQIIDLKEEIEYERSLVF